MSNLIDKTGEKFGRLTVIGRNYPNTRDKKTRWLCKCECGKKTIVRGDQLRRGRTKSCGCLQKEIVGNLMKLNSGLANMRGTIAAYKRSAKQRGLEWDLTEKQFADITQKDCHYCGAKPNNTANRKSSFGEYIYNGIDRIDNNKGYTMNNVVPCCKRCNIAKNNSTLQEYQDWINKSYNKLREINNEII